MSMVIELARFWIHEGADAQLVAERPAMIDALRRRFPGCLAAFLTREDDGSWLDMLLWRSRAEADGDGRRLPVRLFAPPRRCLTSGPPYRHLRM